MSIMAQLLGSNSHWSHYILVPNKTQIETMSAGIIYSSSTADIKYCVQILKVFLSNPSERVEYFCAMECTLMQQQFFYLSIPFQIVS